MQVSKFVNTSHTVFVDDLMSTSATYDSPTLGSMSATMSEALDEAFLPHGLVQNRTKKVSLANTFGPQARTCLRDLHQQAHNINMHARYLGPQIQYDGGAREEVAIRCRHAWQCWYALSNIWRARISMQFKKTCFMASVVSVLFSAMIVFVLSKSDTDKLCKTY